MLSIFLEKLEKSLEKNLIPKNIYFILKDFYISYLNESKDKNASSSFFIKLLELTQIQLKSPFQFDHYHKKIRTPFDYYSFGINFLKPLVKLEQSKFIGIENIKKIKNQLQKKENVFLFGNHQSELDPQILSILLEKDFNNIAEKIIYIAGERVLKDPIAIPFSMGCDVLSIFSKNYINNPPHLKREKHLYNKKTLDVMSSLLKNGEKIIYAAPSGGRDRPNMENIVKISPFDPQSIELLYLMAKKANIKTHFYPLSLSTYEIAPPPNKLQKELGEKRNVKKSKVLAYFGEELDMENFSKESLDKPSKRIKRAKYIEDKVTNGYNILRSI